MTLQRFVVNYIFQPLSLPLNRFAARLGLDGWAAFLLATGLPIFITFFVLGIWHGAGWTFAVFGTLHGIYVVTNTAWREFCRRRLRRIKRAGGVARDAGRITIASYHALTLIAVLFANVMFRAIDVGNGLSIWKSMCGLSGSNSFQIPGFDWGLAATLFASAILVFLLPNTQQIMGRYDPAVNWREWREGAKPPIDWRWKPSISGVFFGGATLFLGLMFIQSGRAVFLYFNF